MAPNLAPTITDYEQMIAALRWHIDEGCADLWLDEPGGLKRAQKAALQQSPSSQTQVPQKSPVAAPSSLGASEAVLEAERLASEARTLDELRTALAGFSGLPVKDTAMNMVFADGRAGARVMVIGEAPDGDEDREGKPFVGQNGQLLDKMLAAIGLERHAENLEEAVYISNVLNWRPPGNRTPTAAEIAISLPFIERHIQLAEPKVLFLLGHLPVRALLQTKESVSRMRGKSHEYSPRTKVLHQDGASPLTVIPCYHPAFLLRNPALKRAAWHDLLMLKDFLKSE